MNAVFARLARDAAHAEHRLPFWWNESEATRRFEYGERRFWVRPDAAGVYYLGEERKPFLLPRGLLGPIWRTPGDPQRRAWLETER